MRCTRPGGRGKSVPDDLGMAFEGRDSPLVVDVEDAGGHGLL